MSLKLVPGMRCTASEWQVKNLWPALKWKRSAPLRVLRGVICAGLGELLQEQGVPLQDWTRKGVAYFSAMAPAA